MRYFIIIIIIITVACCKTKSLRDEIEVYFSPGLVEHEYIDKEMLESVKTPERILEIPLSNYSFLDSIFSNPKFGTASEAVPPYIFVKYNSILYKIGGNRVIEAGDKTFMISENDDYRIKCLIHFYDFIDKDNLVSLQEIKQFGLPDNYKYNPSDPHKPTKPFIKLILKEK